VRHHRRLSLLAEAEEAAARLGVPLSALVEEALRQGEAWRGVEERLANIEALLGQCLQKEARREPAEAQRPPQHPPQIVGGNAWVEILRRRG